MIRKDLIKLCLTMEMSVFDYPFNLDRNNCVVRHTANKKWFALIYNKDDKLYINLKCDPLKADVLREQFSFVSPAYHMNKTHWNTICIDDCTSYNLLYELICESYELIRPKNKVKFFTYILRCSDNTLYCGYTNNVLERVKTHNSGKGAKYTKARLPVILVHCEGFFTKSEALKRECAIKKMTRSEKLELIGEFS